jgi:glutamine amidotransferase
MKLGIIDLDTGNIASLIAAIRKLDLKFKICKSQFDCEDVDQLILPGVGAFKDFMEKIKTNKVDKLLNDKLSKKMSILGICAGFQVLFDKSYEFGENKGLSYLNGDIESFKNYSKNIKIPHVGWNECKILNKNKLFEGIEDNSDFYFTHSYMLKNVNKDMILTETKYGIDFVSSVKLKNIYGVQFHPEKSQINGLKLLKNFYDYC